MTASAVRPVSMQFVMSKEEHFVMLFRDPKSTARMKPQMY